MEEITIERLEVYRQNKEGRPYVTKAGNPFKILRVYDTQGRTIKVMDWNNVTGDWREGSKINLNVESKEYNGSTYLEGTIPNVKSRFTQRVDDLESRIAKLEEKVFGQSQSGSVGQSIKEGLTPKPDSAQQSEGDVVDDDLPF